MKKLKELSLLEEGIATSGIYQAVEVLEKQLCHYERQECILKQRYSVKQEVIETLKILKELKNQLNVLVENSKHWEAPE